jgi:hypothetical protein
LRFQNGTSKRGGRHGARQEHLNRNGRHENLAGARQAGNAGFGSGEVTEADGIFPMFSLRREKGEHMRASFSPDLVISKIYELRGKRVMLDRDLAQLYGVQTRALNQAVRRNRERFPEDFMFSLTRKEIMNLSQFVISSKMKHAPNVFAFTQEGVAMLSSVLRSEKAVKVNILIMRAFVMMRRYGLTYVGLKRKIDEMERKYDRKFLVVFEAIKKLLEPIPDPPAPSEPKKPPIGFRKD